MALHDFTPSAVCLVGAPPSWTLIPRPSFTPKEWLRDSGDMHVAIRSPTPARPEKVAGSAPSATPSRRVSASPRVMMVDLVLSPMPNPRSEEHTSELQSLRHLVCRL